MVRIYLKLLLVFSLLFSGCSKKKEESATSKVELLPTLSASLKEVSPSTTSASSLNLLSTPATKEEALVNFFSSTFQGLVELAQKDFSMHL